MPPRILLMFGCLVGLIEMLAGQTAEGAVSKAMASGASVDAAPAVILPPSTPATSLQLQMVARDSLRVFAPDFSLLDGTAWKPIKIGNSALTISQDLTGEGDFVAVLDGKASGFSSFTGPEVTVQAISAADNKTVYVYVNGDFVGSLFTDGMNWAGITGLETASVEVGLMNTVPVVTSPVDNGHGQGGNPSDTASLADLRIPRATGLIRDHGRLISRQQLIDTMKVKLGGRANGLLLKNTIFLDQETGDDAFDGTTLEVDQKNLHGPKKTWDVAQQAVKSGGTLLVLGNNGIYTATNPMGGMPTDSTLIALGDMLVGPAESIKDLFDSGRWVMTSTGPEKSDFDPSKQINETEE